MFSFVQLVLWVYGYVLIAVAVLSWIPDLSDTTLGKVVGRMAEPYMRPFARLVPSVHVGGVAVNLSYLVGVIVYYIVQQTALTVLSRLLVRGMLS